MKGKVVHLPESVHSELKKHCESLGRSMTDVAVDLIATYLQGINSARVIPVRKKRLPDLQKEERKELPVYALPPFWATNNKSRGTENEQHQGAERRQDAADEREEERGGRGAEDRFCPPEDLRCPRGAEGDEGAYWEEEGEGHDEGNKGRIQETCGQT